MRTRALFMSLGFIAAASLGIVLAHRARESAGAALSAEAIAEQPRVPSLDNSLPILWPAPEFSYLDQDRLPVTDRSLRGHVWVSDFFFTSCTSICPTMTAAMSELLRTIPNPDVRFVSFSVDPDHDTPDRLKEYAKMWKADEARWRFLSTDRERLARTAKGMKVFVRPPDKDASIQHSSLFVLTDPAGMVRGVYDSGEPASLAQLARDALALAGTPRKGPPPVAQPAPASGASRNPDAALFTLCGCRACHAQGRVAPPLEGLYGRTVLLDDGRTVVADEAYLRESLLEPNAKVVAGYPRLMPSYKGQLTPTEIDRLVCYVESLGAEGVPPEGTSALRPVGASDAIDPVCGMAVAVGAETPRVARKGRTYYFCSQTCRSRFEATPGRFTASSPRTGGR